MKNLVRKTLLGAAMVAPMVLALPGTASAAQAGVVVVAGTGTIDPGLPCPSSCQVHLDFTLVGAGVNGTTPVAGVSSCTFDGPTSGAGTLVSDAGSGHIDCTGGVTETGTCTFSRTGPVVLVDCDVTGTFNGHVTAVLVFVPTSAQPTTSFVVAGVGALVAP
jgi:hypothetical protein